MSEKKGTTSRSCASCKVTIQKMVIIFNWIYSILQCHYKILSIQLKCFWTRINSDLRAVFFFVHLNVTWKWRRRRDCLVILIKGIIPSTASSNRLSQRMREGDKIEMNDWFSTKFVVIASTISDNGNECGSNKKCANESKHRRHFAFWNMKQKQYNKNLKSGQNPVSSEWLQWRRNFWSCLTFNPLLFNWNSTTTVNYFIIKIAQNSYQFESYELKNWFCFCRS